MNAMPDNVVETLRAEATPSRAGLGEAPPPDRKTETKNPRRRALMIIIGLGVLAVVGALIYVLLNAGKETTDDAEIDADLVQLAPRVSGEVTRVPVVENQVVKKGDLLLELDDRDYQARLSQAEAELDSARAQADAADSQVAVAEAAARGLLTQAQAGLVGSNRSEGEIRSQAAQARATLASREADLTLAQVNLRRALDLQKANAIPQQQLDQARAQYDSAKAGVEAASESVNAVDEQIKRAQAEVSESQGRLIVSRPVAANIAVARATASYQHARVKSAEATLALAKLSLEWTRVVAPDDGVVSGITAHPGAFLGVGQTVAQFVPDKKYVTANFKETQVGKMNAGQKVDVAVDTYGKTIHGKVVSLSGATGSRFSLFPADNATGNFVKVAQRIPVRIELDDVPSGMALRAGQSVVVTVDVAK
jgi:membrane fusion protein, multidrug efflux system